MDGRTGKSRRGALLLTLVLVAAFGPYIGSGVRTEQAVVYGLGALFLTLLRLRPNGAVLAATLAWGLYVAVALIGAFAPPVNDTPFLSGATVPGLDNAALPLFVTAIVLTLLGLGADPLILLRRAAVTVVVLMCVNAAAALLQLQMGFQWVAWHSGAESNSSLSATVGRYTGLLNAPAEAGELYSVALLCAGYLWSSRPLRLLAVSTVLFVGGLLTVSKVFLLVGLPLALWMLMRARRGRGDRLVLLAFFMVAGWVVVQAGVLPAWVGADHLRLLVPSSSEGLVASFSANRYGGEDSNLARVAAAVLDGHWVFGYGAGGLEVAYDSGWIEALVVAGLFGVVMHAVVFLAFGRAWKRIPRSPERTFLGLLVLLILGASLGIPSLTANRVATVVWVLLIAAASLRAQDIEPHESAEHQRQRRVAA